MFAKDIYVGRRARLMEKVGKGVILLLGNSEASCNYPSNTYKFRQDSSFLYFFGLNEPDMAALLDVESGEQVLFGNDVDIDDIIWMGPQESVKEKAESIGIEKSEPMAELKGYVEKATKAGRKVHFLPPYRNYNKILLNSLLDIPIANLKAEASVELIKAVVDLRIIKDKYELEEIEKACNIGYAMHLTAMKMAKLGMVEQQLYGIMEGIAYSQGAMTSFPTILSQNGETLHNHKHHQILTDGRMVVIDSGAETNMNYCSDFTRTFPSSGKFTQQQKEIYQIVSAANNFAIDLARPGVTYKEVHLAACRLIAQGLNNLGLMKGDVDEAVASGAHALFMPHGLGHNMGLDVHDMEDLGENYVGYDDTIQRSTQFGLASLRMGRMLQPGHVLTVEPGIYFIPALIDKWKAEGINKDFVNFEALDAYRTFGGIRLEDDIVITGNGCRLLGAKRLPITVEDVEREMAE
ncbi:MAG: aminopeptidase P family protein [Bacteroidales bacterium]|nr:aminopeptidase P family protein [Bacteroidales bacterium]